MTPSNRSRHSFSSTAPRLLPDAVILVVPLIVRTVIAAVVLPGFAAIAPPAHAQHSYGMPIHVTSLIGYGVPGSAPEWFSPEGIAADAHGTLYVADSSFGVIHTVAADGTHGTIDAFVLAPNGDRIPVWFKGSTGLGLDAARNLYVSANTSVYRIAPDGATSTLAENLGWIAGIAVEPNGNVYVADWDNHVIYKITPDGSRITFAGKAGESGSANGTGAARFNRPLGVAVDSSGTVYVADSRNSAIRRITPAGVVSTLAAFNSPLCVAVDRFGTVYAIGQAGSAIVVPYQLYQITPDGLAVRIDTSGGFDGNVEPGFLAEIAVDGRGTMYLVDGWWATVLKSGALPTLRRPLANQSVAQGGTAVFSADVVGTGTIRYQWLMDEVEIPGATGASLTLGDVQPDDVGQYAVRVTDDVGTVVSNSADLYLGAGSPDALVNLSVRGVAGSGAETLILGFVVDGEVATDTKPLLVRGVGPTLESLGVAGALSDPSLAVFSGSTIIAGNDDWSGDSRVMIAGLQVGAFDFLSVTSRDAALHHDGFGVGAYTVHVTGVGGATGVALAEIYDCAPVSEFTAATPRLINLSARAHVGTGADILIGGFHIGGTQERTLLIRAVGPTLGELGVAHVLADPTLDLLRGGSLLHSNDNWGGSAAVSEVSARVGAFDLDAASRDAVLLVTLPPGGYTAQVSGVSSTTGVALLEIYDVPGN